MSNKEQFKKFRNVKWTRMSGRNQLIVLPRKETVCPIKN